ncbi:MAG: hypothetical protein PHE73_03675 [Sulfurovaceae bacterium]|nr:hypothetical protein [Sulfurovaceae bacterium]
MNKIKLFLSAVQMYLWIAVGIIILGQGFYIYTQNKDLERKDLEYKVLIGQHKNLADAVGKQNKAIEGMAIDEAKANKKFEAAKASIKQTYQALVDKYKNTPKDKQCEIIIEQNRKEYEEDKGVGYEEI